MIPPSLHKEAAQLAGQRRGQYLLLSSSPTFKANAAAAIAAAANSVVTLESVHAPALKNLP